MQKPYACQIPGCSKRYTDPSSLRKHVKNHTIKDQTQNRRKSTSSSSNTTSTISRRRHSESSNYQTDEPSTPTIVEEQEFSFDDVFNNILEPNNFGENKNNCTMNFNDMSDCIVTIQKNQLDSSEFVTFDNLEESIEEEFVSYDCVKKLLGVDMDYLEQNQIELDYFNNVEIQ